MLQFVNMLRDAFQNMPPQPNHHNLDQQQDRRPSPAATYREFQSVQPPAFRGCSEPTEAQSWITEVEKAFQICRVADDQKTLFASYLLKGEANFWWEAIRPRELRDEVVGENEMADEARGEGSISWRRFKELFFERYFPISMCDRMEARFLELKQGDMSVAEYEAKFNELARFAPHLISTERRKAKRFEQGLKPWLYNKVVVFEIDNYARMV